MQRIPPLPRKTKKNIVLSNIKYSHEKRNRKKFRSILAQNLSNHPEINQLNFIYYKLSSF